MHLIQVCAATLVVLGTATADEPKSGTVELTLEMGSPVVTLTLRAKDGTVRPTRFLVDTGGGAFMLTEAVAAELGLDVQRDAAQAEGGMSFAPMDVPHVEIAGMPLDLTDSRCAAVLDRKSVTHGGTAEGFLPGHVLARHHVIFDYPGQRFTLARPGALEPRGEALASPVSTPSGFPRIELDIGGEKLGFLLDTGASFTMISRAVLDRWKAADPTLATMTGAVGEANMVGGSMEYAALLMRVPAMKWAAFTLTDVAAVSRPEGTFEKWMSGMMTAPIVGAIGGNVLRHFRVEIDYAHGKTYLESSAKSFATSIDAVGLVLGETSDGEHTIDAIAKSGDQPLSDCVLVGDVIRAVDGRSLAGLRHRQVIELLRGEPGTSRVLTLERDGESLEQQVRVVRCLSAGEPTTRAETLPFLEAYGLVFVEVELDGAPLLALLDTGASASAIDTQRGSALRTTGSDLVVGTTGTIVVEMVELTGLSFGSLALPDLRATRRDLGGLLAPEGRTVDMILGSDALARLALTIDFGARTIEVASSPKAPLTAARPMTLDNGIPTIAATIGGIELTLRIDTGASLFASDDVYVNVPAHVWESLRARMPQLTPATFFKGTGADGKEVDLPVARVARARIGSLELAHVFVIVQPKAGYFADPAAKGFVGNNFLAKLGSVTLDYGAKMFGAAASDGESRR